MVAAAKSGEYGRRSSKLAIAGAFQIVLALGLVVLSFLHWPWHPEVYIHIRRRILGVITDLFGTIPPIVPILFLPLLIGMMVWNKQRMVRELEVERNGERSKRLMIVTGELILVGLFMFPFLSHDLELYHAHARMVAVEQVSPYLSTPEEALQRALSESTPWSGQPAPYGPLAIGMQAILVGSCRDSILAALLLKILHALPIGLFACFALWYKRASLRVRLAAAVAVCWQPLILIELAGMGHVEGILSVLSVFCLIAVFLGRPVLAGILLAAAALVKIEGVILLPLVLGFLLRPKEPENKAPPRHWILTFPLLVFVLLWIGYLPFGGIEGLVRSIRVEAAKSIRSVPQTLSFFKRP